MTAGAEIFDDLVSAATVIESADAMSTLVKVLYDRLRDCGRFLQVRSTSSTSCVYCAHINLCRIC